MLLAYIRPATAPVFCLALREQFTTSPRQNGGGRFGDHEKAARDAGARRDGFA
jgi:hypothetical protein